MDEGEAKCGRARLDRGRLSAPAATCRSPSEFLANDAYDRLSETPLAILVGWPGYRETSEESQLVERLCLTDLEFCYLFYSTG